MSNFTRIVKTKVKLFKLSCVRCHFVKFDFYFLGLSLEIFFGVITDNKLHLQPFKNVKRMQYYLNYSGTKFLSTAN